MFTIYFLSLFYIGWFSLFYILLHWSSPMFSPLFCWDYLLGFLYSVHILVVKVVFDSFLCLPFLCWNFLYSPWGFLVFEFYFVFIFFLRSVCKFLLQVFYHCCFKNLSYGFNISVILMLTFIYSLFHSVSGLSDASYEKWFFHGKKWILYYVLGLQLFTGEDRNPAFPLTLIVWFSLLSLDRIGGEDVWMTPQ